MAICMVNGQAAALFGFACTFLRRIPVSSTLAPSPSCWKSPTCAFRFKDRFLSFVASDSFVSTTYLGLDVMVTHLLEERSLLQTHHFLHFDRGDAVSSGLQQQPASDICAASLRVRRVVSRRFAECGTRDAALLRICVSLGHFGRADRCVGPS